MRRLLVGAIVCAGAIAQAQVIDVREMHGIPRPEPKLPPGTVTVRLIRGSLAKRVPDTEVTLGGRSAKTDAEGRARFDGIPVGTADLVAKATVDTLALESQSFTLPPDSGIAILLTTPPAPEDLPQVPTAGMPDPGMPDPMEAHGIAIPRDQVPLGTLRVTLLRNGWGSAASNHYVDLVGIDADGQTVRQREVTDSKGQVTFKGLRRRYAYYALAMVDGKEVSSSAVVPAADSGQAMVLTAARTTEEMVPGQVFASAQVPAGALMVGAFKNDQEFASDARAKLYGVGPQGRVSIGSQAAADDRGILTFPNLPRGEELLFVVEVERGEQAYWSKPFHLLPGDAGTVLPMLVPDQPVLVALHAGAELEDMFLHFQVQYTIENVTGAPLDFGQRGLRLPLPHGFVGGQVAPDKAAQIKVVGDEGIAWRGSVPPGQDRVTLGFSLQIEDGKAALRWDAPLGLAEWLIVMDDIDGMKTVAPAGVEKQTMPGNDGRSFTQYRSGRLDPGGEITFAFSGLPQPPASIRHKRIAFTVAAALLLLGGIVVALFAGFGLGGRRTRRRMELERQSERLYAELTALAKRFLAGRLDEKSYLRQRKSKQDELERTLRELDGVIDEALA